MVQTAPASSVLLSASLSLAAKAQTSDSQPPGLSPLTLSGAGPSSPIASLMLTSLCWVRRCCLDQTPMADGAWPPWAATDVTGEYYQAIAELRARVGAGPQSCVLSEKNIPEHARRNGQWDHLSSLQSRDGSGQTPPKWFLRGCPPIL